MRIQKSVGGILERGGTETAEDEGSGGRGQSAKAMMPPIFVELEDTAPRPPEQSGECMRKLPILQRNREKASHFFV